MTNITPLGDLHNGRQTCLIETENEQFISKPRSCQTEEAFVSFCRRMESLGLPTFVHVPHIIKKGVCEHTQQVVQNLETDENGAELYYIRAGVLLFFSYILGSIDLHCENLIACGDTPVLIDLETLLSGLERGASDAYNLTRTVMRSHLLCNFIKGKDVPIDVSGFSGATAQLKNIPHTQNGRVFPWDKRASLIKGFKTAYQFALSHKEEIVQAIDLFDDCQFRQILRSTQTYAAVSAALLKLSPDERASKAYEWLSRAYLNDMDADRVIKAERALQCEINAVCQGEVPLFYTYGNGGVLYCNGSPVLSDYLQVSPVDYAISRVEALSETDLKRQCSLISQAINACSPQHAIAPSIYIKTGCFAPGEQTAESVMRYAVDGLSTMFVGLRQDNRGNVYFATYDYSLYQGLSGVLCMLAAMYRKTEKPYYKEQALRCYENIIDVHLKNNRPIFLDSRYCSLADGVTGVISCLHHAGQLMENDEFLQGAQSIASRLTVSTLLTDTDYLNGVGALPLILSKLHFANQEELMATLSNLFKQVAPQTTGMAHGASGMALSLCALQSTLQSEERILELLQWENKHFDCEVGNWRDMRINDGQPHFMSGWCAGAPGIGMARAYIEAHTHSTEIRALCRQDIDRVRLFLQKQTPSKRDTLCCGTASRLMAASVLGVCLDDTYKQLLQAEKQGTCRVFHVAKTADANLSLMQGLSGIAYVLALYGDPLCGGMLL